MTKFNGNDTRPDEHYKLADELEKVLTPKYQAKLHRLLELEHELTLDETN